MGPMTEYTTPNESNTKLLLQCHDALTNNTSRPEAELIGSGIFTGNNTAVGSNFNIGNGPSIQIINNIHVKKVIFMNQPRPKKNYAKRFKLQRPLRARKPPFETNPKTSPQPDREISEPQQPDIEEKCLIGGNDVTVAVDDNAVDSFTAIDDKKEPESRRIDDKTANIVDEDIKADLSGDYPKFSLTEKAKKELYNPSKNAVIRHLLGRTHTSCFNDELISSVVAWVSFPNMPLHLYNKKVLFVIAGAIGKPIKIDYTEMITRGKFARIAVQIDLKKPLVDQFEFDGVLQKVEYEGLYKENCPKMECNSSTVIQLSDEHTVMETERNKEEKDENYGEWMVVENHPRRNLTGKVQKSLYQIRSDLIEQSSQDKNQNIRTSMHATQLQILGQA